MTWVHIPPGLDTAYPCAPVAAASISASCSPSRISTPDALSNGRNTLDRPSSPASGPDTSPRPQSGTICAHSMPDHGRGISTPCWPDTPASHSALLESASARTTSGISGPRSPDAPANSALASNGSSSKTSRDTSASALKPCCENFGTWVSRLRLAYSQRLKLARRMKGSGSSSWPTATRTDANGARSFALDGTRIRANAGPTLNDLASSWPTPRASEQENRTTRSAPSHGTTHGEVLAGVACDFMAIWGTPRASDGEKGGPNQSFGAGGMPLPAQAAQWQTPVADDQMDRLRGKINSRGEPKLSAQALQWPTPAAQNWKGSSEASITRADGKSRMDILHYRAEQGFTRPAPAITLDGRQPSSHALISRPLWASMIASHGRAVSRRILKARARRQLNPLFVEWLMGWPPGHALCACSATEFTRWQRDMRGALLRLPMASGPWIWAPSDGAETDNPQQMSLFG